MIVNKKLFFKVTASFCVIVAALATLEITLRIKDGAIRTKQQQKHTQSSYIADDKLIWTRPDKEYFWKDKSKPLTQNKVPGVKRIFFMGDSFTKAPPEGAHLGFYDQLQSKLEKQFPNKYEYFHFGVSGYSEFQHLELLKRFAPQFNPDLIIVQVYLGNDIGENGGLIKRSLNDQNKKEVTYHSQDKWNLKEKKENLRQAFDLHQWLSSHSFAYNWLKGKSRWIIWRFKGIDLKHSAQDASKYVNTSPHILQLLSVTPSNAIKQAWDKTETITSQLISQAKNIKAEILFVLIPHELQVNDKVWNDITKKYQLNPHEFDRQLPSRRFKQFLDSQNTHCLDLTHEFNKQITQGNVLYKGHFTLKGHAETALAIYDVLQKKY